MNKINLDSHYTTDVKVKRPVANSINPPANLGSNYVFNEKEVNKKLNQLNQDIYNSYKKEKRKSFKEFCLVVIGVGLAILAFCGSKKIFNFFKKS